ncbi:tetraprenyl-beta-curcumene synthase family protein [Oceanobacillus senegalensis]|uniref:tetraprenyl-beta-curcumene synthase family protein n=1 Tax=Oceanobacillus senegalensis TaxID=1936063 RepID=UPI000A30C8B4|nr:tetraprenyl-beta-curcumene synthase family protein [Oceanobacillus senegalensis]
MSYVPSTPLSLVTTVFRRIFPQVNHEINYWKKRANQIPNKELRTQALSSIASKKFHCQGGAVFSLLAGDKWKEAVRFIVAYQTISDYLDNLCDRSTSLNPNDFKQLHLSAEDALQPENQPRNYYKLREDQDDGNYLYELVVTCQQTISMIHSVEKIKVQLIKLEDMYSSLQVHKHVRVEERVPRLTHWYEENNRIPTLSWYEFAAATGSTLGIFCLVSYALSGKMSNQLASNIYEGYFPYIQGLHILLDYFIDQNEDLDEGDLNFCSFYPNNEKMIERFSFFIQQADKRVEFLPNPQFHKMVCHGLVGLYLGDIKVKSIKNGNKMAKELLKISGYPARFFQINTRMYYKLNGNGKVV